MINKDSVIGHTVADKGVRLRDAYGRFVSRANQVGVQVNLATVKVADEFTTAINLYPKFKGVNAPPLYVKAVETSIPKIESRGAVIQYQVNFLPGEAMITRFDCYNGMLYIGYTSIDGQYKAHYIPDSFKFVVIDNDHVDYQRTHKTFEDRKVDDLWQSLSHNFSIGSDPEIFVENGKDGRLIPAFLFLPGKDSPASTTNTYANFSTYGGCSMYWDGFQAEFTTRPNMCLGHHGDSIAAGIHGVWQAARAKFPDAKLSMQSVFHIDPDILMTADDEHVAFGCMPSINAYGLRVNMPPAREVPFRSAGGHIHFGTGRLTQKSATPMVKALDAILGVACVSLFAEFDDPNRRKLYGLPGEYRLPPHGLEYRPLSNAWLCHPMIMNLVIDLARKCVVFGRNDFMKYWDATEEETLACIIECDVEASHRILDRNKRVFTAVLHGAYTGAAPRDLECLYMTFVNGIRSAIQDPCDFVNNWCLERGWTPHSGRHDEPNVAKFMRQRQTDPKFKF